VASTYGWVTILLYFLCEALRAAFQDRVTSCAVEACEVLRATLQELLGLLGLPRWVLNKKLKGPYIFFISPVD
jgi:hypothetical protein